MPTIPCTPHGCKSHGGSTLPSLPGVTLPAVPTTPEALCSVNVRFRIEGYPDYAQATGRGATAQEAARNLADTIRETNAVLETPPPPPSREARLATLLTCGLAKAASAQDWTLVEKLSKAAALVLSGAVSPGEREGLLAVQSQSTPAHWYEVDGRQCTCPDYRTRAFASAKPFWCKHALAAAMYRKVEEAERRAP